MNRLAKAAAILCLVLGSCTSQRERPMGPAPALDRPGRPAAAPMSPADYVANAASTDLLALKFSELAHQRSTSKKIRDLAQRMRSLHEGTSGQLAFAARRLDLPTSPVLRPEDEVRLRQLQQAAAFDRTYILQQKELHRRAVELHDGYRARGTSPTLRTVAAFAAGRLREHQGIVDAL